MIKHRMKAKAMIQGIDRRSTIFINSVTSLLGYRASCSGWVVEEPASEQPIGNRVDGNLV